MKHFYSEVRNTPEQAAQMQQAVVETALAYFRKGDNIRYSFRSMTHMERRTVGITQLTVGAAPEMASRDFWIYNNCVQFTYSVYWDAFRRGLAEATDRTAYVPYFNTLKSAEDPDIVLKFGGRDGMQDRDAFIARAKELLQPGDVVNTLEDNIARNHSMLYLGDCRGDGKRWAMHSSGGPAGIGTMKMEGWELFLGSGPFGAANKAITSITILRPINVISYEEMTPAAHARLRYPGLTVEREASLWQGKTPRTGEEITVTLTLRNGSTAAYRNMTLTDPAPVGAVLVEDSLSGGKATDCGGVVWQTEVPAGQAVTLSYRIRVTAALRQQVTLPAGSLCGLPTRPMEWQVGGEPVPADAFAVQTDAVPGLESGTNTMELDFVNVFYRSVLGLELGLPATMNQLLRGLFRPVFLADKTPGGYMLEPRDRASLPEAMGRIRDMILPRSMGGQSVYLPVEHNSMEPHGRLVNYFPESYEPGDVFLLLEGPAAISASQPLQVLAGIYLGDGRVLTADAAGAGVCVRRFDILDVLLQKANVALCLRPYLCDLKQGPG